jgi:hypothetical protein
MLPQKQLNKRQLLPKQLPLKRLKLPQQEQIWLQVQLVSPLQQEQQPRQLLHQQPQHLHQ